MEGWRVRGLDGWMVEFPEEELAGVLWFLQTSLWDVGWLYYCLQ
jgi:hypothetical protein